MKRLLYLLTLALGLAAASPVHADDADQLAGKWTINRTTKEGVAVKQTIEFKKDKFEFQIQTADEKIVLYAQGKFKLDKAGDLKTIKFTDIQAGQSKDELQSVDDERSDVYTLRDDKLILGSNFDKQRDNEEPATESYAKAATTPKKEEKAK